MKKRWNSFSSYLAKQKIPMFIGFAFICAVYFTTSNLFAATGAIWTQATANAAFHGTCEFSSVEYDNKMWIVGGSGSGFYMNDVWYSSDGITWTQATPDPGFSNRVHPGFLVFNGLMWVIGGADTGDNCKNDAWYSSNGVDWTAATTTAAYTPRQGHSCIVYDNKMWIIGGWYNYNDVWYSSDGVNWIQATASAAFGPRSGHTSLVFNDKMWVIGGYNGGSFSDVWCSTDGVIWSRVTENAAFGGRYAHSSVVFDNKMWVVGGGYDPFYSTFHNDVWYSTDGCNWYQATSSAAFGARNWHASVVHDNKMWVIGGWAGGNNVLNDVWYSEADTPTVTPTGTWWTDTPTATGTNTYSPTCTFTRTVTPTPTLTLTPTITFTPTITWTPGNCLATGNVQVCGVADDYMTLWINGIQVGVGSDFRFANIDCLQYGVSPAWGVCPTPICISMPASVLNLTNTGNVIAAYVQNAQSAMAFGSWTIDITCSGGEHVYIADNSNDVLVYNQQETGSAPSCSGSAPPGTGTYWYDKNFIPSGWSNAIVVDPSFIWTRQLFNQITGRLAPALSDRTDASHANQCDNLYFRQTFNLNPVPIPPTPALTLVKSVISPASGPVTGMYGAVTVLTSLKICNAGTAIADSVTVIDSNPSFYSSSRFNGVSFIDKAGWERDSEGIGYYPNYASGVSILYFMGLPGVAWNGASWMAYCNTVTVASVNFYFESSLACQVLQNDISTTGGITAISNVVSVTMMCTPTHTSIFTRTATLTKTSTPTGTWYNSTYTPTHTPTPTNTCTSTCSSTDTPTFTPTPVSLCLYPNGWFYDSSLEGWNIGYNPFSLPLVLFLDGAQGSPDPGSMFVSIGFTAGSQEIELSYMPSPTLDLSLSQVCLRMRSDSGNVQARVFLKTTSSWVWGGGPIVSLTPGVWTGVVINPSSPESSSGGYNPAEILQVGVEIISADANPAELHIDSWSYSTPYTVTPTDTETWTPTPTRTSTYTMTRTPMPTPNPTLWPCEWTDADGTGIESVNVSNSTGTVRYPSMCLDGAGRPHIAWADDRSGNWEVYYLRWDGAQWVDVTGDPGKGAINVSNNSGSSGTGAGIWNERVSLCLDGLGRPHIAWEDDTTGNFEIYYLEWNGSNWVDIHGDAGKAGIDVSNNPGTSRFPSMVLDGGGRPHIAWHDATSPGGVYYLKWDGTAWVDADGVGQESVKVPWIVSVAPYMALDGDGHPHIVGDNSSEIYYIKYNGTEWTDADGTGHESIDISNTPGNTDYAPSICVDGSNHPHVAWHTAFGMNGIMYQKWNGTAWVDADGVGLESRNISGGVYGEMPSLALDGAGNPHVAWGASGTNREIDYLYWNGSAWVGADGISNSATNVSNNSGESNVPWLCLDGSGYPHIAWTDATSGSNQIYHLEWHCLTPSPTPTDTPTRTPSSTDTFTPTATSTTTPAYTATPSSTGTPTLTPTASYTDTYSWTPTPTSTHTMTSSPTRTFTASQTASPTVTRTPTVTDTPTITWSPTVTYTPTITLTPTDSMTATPSLTASHTPPYPETSDAYAFTSPGNVSVNFIYFSPKAQEVWINVYNFTGVNVAALAHQAQKGNENRATLSTRDFAPGVFFYVIRAKDSGEIIGKGKFLAVRR